jgi:hypothetical protein
MHLNKPVRHILRVRLSVKPLRARAEDPSILDAFVILVLIQNNLQQMGVINNVPLQIATVGISAFLLIQVLLVFVFFNGVSVQLFSKLLPICRLDWNSNRPLLSCQAAVIVLGTCYSALVLYYMTSITENSPDDIARCAILGKMLGVVLFSLNFFVYQFLLLRAKAVELSKVQKWFRKTIFVISFLELALIAWYGIEFKPVMILLGDGVTYSCGTDVPYSVTLFYGFLDIVMNIGCLVLFVLPLRQLINYRKNNDKNYNHDQGNSFSIIIRRNFRSSLMCVVINLCLLVVISSNDDVAVAFTFVHAAYSTVSSFACLYATSFAWEQPHCFGARSNEKATDTTNTSKA